MLATSDCEDMAFAQPTPTRYWIVERKVNGVWLTTDYKAGGADYDEAFGHALSRAAGPWGTDNVRLGDEISGPDGWHNRYCSISWLGMD